MKPQLVILLGIVAAAGGALAQVPAQTPQGPGQFIAGPATCPSGGNVIVTTPPNLIEGFVSDANFPQTMAAQFTLTSPTTFGEVVIFGAFWPVGTAPGGETFRVLLREDVAGFPGTIVSDEPGITPTSLTATGAILAGVNELEVVLPLSPPPMVPGLYWLEIFSETFDPDDSWVWETGGPPLDPNQSPDSAFAFDIPGMNWLPVDRTEALTLCDASIPVEVIEFVVE